MGATELTDVELKIAIMWEHGYNTLEIAQSMRYPDGTQILMECHIYGLLPGIREKRRRQAEERSRGT